MFRSCIGSSRQIQISTERVTTRPSICIETKASGKNSHYVRYVVLFPATGIMHEILVPWFTGSHCGSIRVCSLGEVMMFHRNIQFPCHYPPEEDVSGLRHPEPYMSKIHYRGDVRVLCSTTELPRIGHDIFSQQIPYFAVQNEPLTK